MEKYRGSGWSYLLLERIYFLLANRIGAEHLNPIRDWASLRLDFRYCKDWSTCGLFPLLWCGPSKNFNCKSRNRTTRKSNYWKLHSTSCSSLTHCSAFISLSKIAYKLENVSRGNQAQNMPTSLLFWILTPQVLTDSETAQCLQTNFFH